MFGYYLDLALRSLKRNRVLTTLMVLSLALGIGGVHHDPDRAQAAVRRSGA